MYATPIATNIAACREALIDYVVGILRPLLPSTPADDIKAELVQLPDGRVKIVVVLPKEAVPIALGKTARNIEAIRILVRARCRALGLETTADVWVSDEPYATRSGRA